MSWNYRVCSYTTNGETLFGIREVYYDTDGRVKRVAAASAGDWTSAEDVKRTLEMMLKACDLPVVPLDSLTAKS